MFKTNIGNSQVRRYQVTLEETTWRQLESTPFVLELPDSNYHLINATAKFSDQTNTPDCGGWFIEDSNGTSILSIAVPLFPNNGGFYLTTNGDINIQGPDPVTLQLITDYDDIGGGNGDLTLTLLYAID